MSEMTQWEFSAPFEGITYHLCLDERGSVVCGVRFLIPNKAALDRYAWKPDVLAADEDYDRVRRAEPGHVSRYYLTLCTAEMVPENVRQHFDSHVQALASDPLMRAWELPALPNAARVALLDMAMTPGVVGLHRNVRLRAAVSERRWADAAAASSRPTVRPARNTATRNLFLSLVGA